MRRFSDRQEAGRALAQALASHAGRSDVIVLGLPRGGVLVAAEVARELRVPLDVYSVRKLGVPWNREFALGAIATGGVQLLDSALMRQVGVSLDEIRPIIESEERELARRDALFRGGREPLELRGKVVIVADDGLATGATMAAAAEAIRALGATSIVAAVPVASVEACEAIASRTDECVCLLKPTAFHGVGFWYDDFHDVGDEEVLDALSRHPPACPVA